jgi:hypothetical protein
VFPVSPTPMGINPERDGCGKNHAWSEVLCLFACRCPKIGLGYLASSGL